METTDRYRRFLKRKNFSPHTVKNYMNILSHFTDWLTIPLAEVTRREMGVYVDHLLRKRLISRRPSPAICKRYGSSSTISYDDEGMKMANPVTKISIRLPKPLPRHLKDDQVRKLFAVITDPTRQGHVHAHAPLRSSGGGGRPAHRGCSRASTEPALCRQRKRRQGQGCLFE